MRIIGLTLCLFALMMAVSPALMAQDAPKRPDAAMSDSEDAQLAARAAEAPDLANFSGGDEMVIIYPSIAIVILIVVLIIILV